MKTDFCEYCGANMKSVERRVTVHRHSRGRHYIFEEVPARVCPRCGERYFAASVVRQMDRQM
jgi:YgiT-type zinc finger domain-containing protein